jgi:hypothetical protein
VFSHEKGKGETAEWCCVKPLLYKGLSPTHKGEAVVACPSIKGLASSSYHSGHYISTPEFWRGNIQTTASGMKGTQQQRKIFKFFTYSTDTGHKVHTK